MKIRLNYVYQDQNGEYFLSVKHKGTIVLSNPSYPFFFLPKLLEPLKEIGKLDKYVHLIKKKDYQFQTGNSCQVEVENSQLKLVKNK